MRDFAAYSHKRKVAKRRKQILLALCLVVVLGAGWVLMRPAITLSDSPECGLEEHTHTPECYTEETTPPPLTCGVEEHEHGDNCFDPDGNLTCEKEEHTHEADCYGEPETYRVLTCGISEHTHDDSCYPVPDPTPAYTVGEVLSCGYAEHVHAAECYDGGDLICTIPEHTHTDACKAKENRPEETQDPWDLLTDEEKRAALLSELEIETGEDKAAFDQLLETYDKTLDEIHKILLDNTADLVGKEKAVDDLDSLTAYLEAHKPASEETEETEATGAAEETEPEALTQEPALVQLAAYLNLETQEQLDALNAILETYQLTPTEILDYIAQSETDPEAEKITDLESLKALIESAFAVDTMAAEDGIFRKKDETAAWSDYVATVTVDGITFTASATYSTSQVEGCRLHVVENTISTDEEGNVEFPPLHGVLHGFKSYTVEVLNTDGTLFSHLYMPSLILKSENQNLQVYCKQETTREQGVVGKDNKSYPLTSISYSALGNNTNMPSGKSMEIITYDSIVYSSKYRGSYELGYILSNYNAFVETNYIGTHVVGPMIVGGRAYRWKEGTAEEEDGSALNLGGLSAENALDSYGGAPHQVPSYYGETSATQIITGNMNIPVYLGDKNKTMAVDYKKTGESEVVTTANYVYADSYIDFTTAMKSIQSQMDDIVNNETQTPETNTPTKLTVGGTYVFDASAFKSVKDDLRIVSSDSSEGDVLNDTIIIIKGKDVVLPHISEICGIPTGSVEYGQGSGVVFLCPDAESVSGHNITGHVVAPNAYVNYLVNGERSGYYNGCVIAKKFHSGGAEGHMWPYNGQRLVPARTPLRAIKWMNGEPLSDDSAYKFDFACYEQTRTTAEDGTVTYTYAEEPATTGVNVGSDVTFDFIEFEKAGTYYYKIVEKSDKTHPGILFDTKAYYAKVEVEGTVTLKANIDYYSDEACDKPLGENVYPTFNNRYGEKLPDTGGVGGEAVAVVGALLMALSLAGLTIKRKRRAA